jgi:glycosyltransferase involved in cell wall biosynthesis
MLLPRLIRKLNAAVTEFGPDIVHTSLNVANHATRLTALLMRWRIPVITSVRVDFRSGYRRHEKILERLLWRRSAHIVTNAQRTREQLVADLGIPEDRVSVIANGVADEFFCRDPGPPPPWWPEGRVALTVGRYTPQKNHLGLVAAIASLKERSLIGDWRFVFLGEGPMGPDIRTAIDAAGLNDRIVMAAPETEMPPIYRAASLFILPSLFEGLPNALLEAAAARCPIAASPGANEAGVVTPGRGWLLGDPLADSLAVPLQAPGPALAAAADVASAHVRDRFSGATATARTAAIYRRLAANAGRRGRCGSR